MFMKKFARAEVNPLKRAPAIELLMKVQVFKLITAKLSTQAVCSFKNL